MEDKFNLEHRYQLFLKKMGMPEDKMHPIQKKQIKDTFFAVFGIALVMFRDDVADYEEDKGVEIMQNLFDQVFIYVKKEMS